MKSRLTFVLTSLLMVVMGCAPSVTQQEAARAVEGYIEDVDKLFVVDCLLPGQMRKLGSAMTYLSARRPIRTTEADCEVRGGEYVAYDRANYTSALNVWLEKANEGDATAQLYVGQIYEKGLGRPADYKAAAAWYRKAADQGNAQAQINLGHLYEKGLGVPKAPQAAIGWYGKAAGLENAGLMYASASSASPRRAASPPPATAMTVGMTQPNRSASESTALTNQLAEARKLREQLHLAQQQLLDQQALLRQSQAELASVKSTVIASPKPESRTDDAQMRAREKALDQKEAQLKIQQTELSRMHEQVDAERARMQREQTVTPKAPGSVTPVAPPPVDERRIRELETALKTKETQLKAKQTEISRMNEAIDTERAQMQRDMASLIRQSNTPAAGAPPADEARIRQLEADLQSKEALLKSQQAKVSNMSKAVKAERAKMQKELNAALQRVNAQASVPPAGSPAILSQSPQLTQARQTVTQIDSELEAKTANYNAASAELTGWLTQPGDAGDAAARRVQIDQRKAELLAHAQEITTLRERLGQASKQLEELERAPLQLAQGGPRIEIIQPQILLTRGIPSLSVSSDIKELLGKVDAAEGLKSLTANDKTLNADASGLFRIPFEQAPPDTLRITAIDRKNQRTDFNLNLVVENPSVVSAPIESGRTGQPLSFRNIDMGKYYALIIGNSDYSIYPDLKTPLNDARSIDVLLRERYGFSTKVVLNGNRHAIMTAFNEIQRRLTEKDNLLIYYAGHGEIDAKTQEAYWLPIDAETGNPANWIPSKAITDLLSIMPARHILVVSDSCYSGAMTGAAVAKLPDDMDPDKKEKWLRVMATKKARTVLTSGDVKPVLDEGGEGHSIFAEAFLRSLRSNKGLLEDYELYRDVAAKVATASAKIGFTQTPSYAPLQYAGHEGSPFFFLPGS